MAMAGSQKGQGGRRPPSFPFMPTASLSWGVSSLPLPGVEEDETLQVNGRSGACWSGDLGQGNCLF